MANTLQKMIRAKRNGIKRVFLTMTIAREEKVPFAVLCAFLEQESAGGENVFGHDPTIYVGAGKVTKKKYKNYKIQRQAGFGQQGVGPMQLTWWEFQDRADALGGAWKPKNNLRVGAQLLREYHDLYGNWYDVATRYNGSTKYADQVAGRLKKWREILA